MMSAGDHRDTGPLRDGAAPAATQRQDRHRQPGRQGGARRSFLSPICSNLAHGPGLRPADGRSGCGRSVLPPTGGRAFTVK